MDINLYSEQRVRIKTYSGPYIDIQHVGYESLAVDIHGQNGYVELRKKSGSLRLFQFIKKSHKKECDFGYWNDAEIVFSYNRDGKDKPIS